MQEIGQHKQIEVRRSPLHGWGVFALEDIPAGELVETAPGIKIPFEILSACYYIVLADGIPPSELQLDQYGLGWVDDKVCIPLGWVGLYNHSDSHSAEFCYNHGIDTVSIRAIRDISAGEEITVYYGQDWWARKSYLQKNEP